MKLVYEEKIKLRTEDFDYKDIIKPSAILNLFQDIAGIHATNIGLGFKATFDLGLYWILVRTYYEVYQDLKPLTEIKLITFPHQKGKIDCDREYIIKDLDDNILVRGISKWVVIDISTRKLHRTDNVIFPNGEYEKPYFDTIKKHQIPDTKFEKVYTYKVMKSDIDHNGHTNNAIYADIIYEVLDDINIKKFYIDYIKETKKDDVINIYKYELDDNLYFIGYKDDEKIFTANIIKG